MRGIFLFVVLVAAVARGEETPVRPKRFHPHCCEVIGTKFVTPRQLEAQLSWDLDFLNLCYAGDDPATFATKLKALLVKEYHSRGFWDVSVAITPQPNDRFKVEIAEGARFKCGSVKFVGAKRVDTDRLARWMAQTVPKDAKPIVLAVDDKNQPTLQRLPNGQLRRESATDAAAQITFPDQLAKELQHDPLAKSRAEPKPTEAMLKALQVSSELQAASPLWVTNNDVPEGAYYLPMIEKWLPLGFAEQGFSQARFRVELIPQPSNATVQLTVVILEEGPATRIQAIEVTQLRHNGRDSILKLLDLNVGQQIDADRVRLLEEQLAETGRFLLHEITIGPADDDGNATVYLDLRELPRGPALTDELSDDQLLLLRAANELNRWRESQTDFVLSSSPNKDAPRDGGLGSFEWKAVITPERFFFRLRSQSADGKPCELWLMVGDGLLEFASSELRQRGRIPFAPCLDASFGVIGKPNNPAGGTSGIHFDWECSTSNRSRHRIEFHHEPSVWLSKSLQEVKSQDGTRSEFAFVPTWHGDIAETAIIERKSEQGGVRQSGAGRIVSHCIKSKSETLRLEPRRGALAELLAESRLSAADFEDVTSKPILEAQFVKLVLQAVNGAGLKCPGLSRDQQTLAASILKRLDVEKVGKALLANSPPVTTESLLGSGLWPLAMHCFSSLAQDASASGDVGGAGKVLRHWLALSHLAARMTLTEPVAPDSGIAEQLRFDAIGFLGLTNQTSVEVMTSRADFGPLAGLLGATGLFSKAQDQTRQSAANGIARLDQFDQERRALLTPGTASHSLAIVLLDLLRQSPAGERRQIESAFSLSDAQKLQVATFWKLLDQAQSAPTTELLPLLVDAAWSAGLKNVVETELEHALFGDIARGSQMAMLASQGLQTMERRRFQDAVMWIDRAEANFLEYVESVPERRRNAAFEDDRRQRMAHLSTVRTVAKLGCGDFDAAYAAAQNTLEYYQRRCAEMGDEPAIDDFAGTLTKRGKMLGLVVGTRLQIASVEWHRSGRDAALKQVALAEVLVREFEIKDASAEAKICAASPLAAASLFYAYADKNGRRDPAQAMVLAKRAYDLGGDQMGLALDAMACASAANGNFEEAIEWARRGDELITGVPNKWLTQARIQRFKNRQLPIDEFVVPTATADAPDSRRR